MNSLYSNLPVYRDCYAVALEFAKTRPELPRDTRYTIAQDLSRTLVGMMVTIYRANSSRADKARLIAELRRQAVEAQIYFRLLSDLHQLGVRREAFFMDRMASIGKQLAAWHKSAVKDESSNAETRRHRDSEGDNFGAKTPSPADGWPECAGPRSCAASRKANPISGAGATAALPAAKGGLAANTEATP